MSTRAVIEVEFDLSRSGDKWVVGLDCPKWLANEFFEKGNLVFSSGTFPSYSERATVYFTLHERTPLLKLWTCVDHDGHNPVPRASVVFAATEEEARRLLDEQLKANGLKASHEKPYTLIEVDMTGPKAIVLGNGEY